MQLQLGIILVGKTGSGKTECWETLRNVLETTENVKYRSYLIDPKAIKKDQLFGKLDETTLEWSDGIFTSILRTIISNQKGEMLRNHWIVFDGDIDPEWVENLNSVLDDNRTLTLPNGERLVIPENVRILFEVHTLKYATLATVSRCGMICMTDNIVPPINVLFNLYNRLKNQ